jgi:hypothetical protein
MKRLLAGLFLVLPFAIWPQTLQMRQVAQLPDGDLYRGLLCGDSDHDTLNEITFRSSNCPAACWKIYEATGMNRYDLAFADSVRAWPPPPGPQSGELEPWGIGDVDGDSLTDLLGLVRDGSSGPWHWDLITEESSTYHSYPDTVSWYDSVTTEPTADLGPCYLAGNLDNDGRQDILYDNGYDGCIYVYENEGDNHNRRAWRHMEFDITGVFAVGDFDGDGLREFVTAGASATGIKLYKSVGGDTYPLAWTDTINHYNADDLFSGDVDGDGIPEFFISFADGADFYLYMFKAMGTGQYGRVLVDHIRVNDLSDAQSRCGDIDGDGKNEIIWSVGEYVNVYRYLGQGQFQRVWQWASPSPDDVVETYVNVYDLNRNGYKEMVLSGNFAGAPGYPVFETFMYEVEAIRLLNPNGGESFQAGDTQTIRWRTFTPPRCDSVSLFFTTDNGRSYRPIAHGLTPNSDTFVWVIPGVHGDSCKVKAIAFGPGRQYDESDSCFSIWSAGVKEGHVQPLAETRLLGATPNPMGGETQIRYQLRHRSKVEIRICDVAGRTIAELPDEVQEAGLHSIRWEAGRVPKGVYFVSFETPEHRESRKLILTE